MEQYNEYIGCNKGSIARATYLTYNPEVSKSMNLTFHKWVLNAMTAPNPTPMSKSGKYNVKNQIMKGL